MDRLTVEVYEVGRMRANCIFIINSDKGIGYIVDPGDDPDYLKSLISQKGFKPVAVIATHGHYDHIQASVDLQLCYSILFWANRKDEFIIHKMEDSSMHFENFAEMRPFISRSLEDGDSIDLGDIPIRVISTPGHTPGSISLHFPMHKLVICGDILFKGGGIGSYHHTYSSFEMLKSSILKILDLESQTSIITGHGEPTTVETEKKGLISLLNMIEFSKGS